MRLKNPNSRIRKTTVGMLAILIMILARLGEAQTTWYTVELIVFQHLSNDGLYSERWPLEAGRPTIETAIQLTLAESEDPSATETPSAFQLLPRSEFQLTEAAGRLKRSGGYRPLLHVAWRQPGYTRSEAKKVHIHSDIPNRFRISNELDLNPDHVIDGTVRLSRSRYLHLEADLLHERETPVDSPTEVTTFRLQDSRRMRSREIHYIDHPLIGLLVLVTPYEPIEEELDSEELSESSELSN